MSITKCVEIDRKVRADCTAARGEDAAELARLLRLSSQFESVTLVAVPEGTAPPGRVAFAFELEVVRP